ncbi:PAS domain-containing sensor histidine kinase [Fibrella aestuarina]|nr:ATP-binding protein [Fibrella aestuarina]
MKNDDGMASTRLKPLIERAFDASVNGVIVLEAIRNEQGQLRDFRFGVANEVGLRAVGHTRDSLLGQTVRDIYPASSGLFDQYRQVLETGERQTVETYYPDQNSWRAITVVPIEEGVMVTYLDITARKKADEAVSQQAQLLNDIMESGPMGLVVLKAEPSAARVQDFSVVRMNSLFRDEICQSKTDLIGKPLAAAFHNARESGLLSRCILGVKLGEAQEFEMPSGTNGHRNWYRVAMAPQNDQLILALTDVTATRTAQLAYHSQAQLLGSVLDGSQNAIVAFDAIRNVDGQITNFRFVLQNEANRRWMKRTDKQLAGCTLLDFFTANHAGELMSRCRQVVDTDTPYRGDITYDYGAGPGFYNLSIVRRGDGVVLTMQDKTSEKLAEDNLLANQQQLEAANQELRRSNDNLQSFTYIASHDLQEPLRKIQSFGDILKNQRAIELGPDVELLERMQSAARRMSMLIQDLLTYSRLSTHKEITNSVALNAVVTDVLLNLELAVTESGATFDVPELPVVRGDASQLRQLFQNLFSNAIKFRKAGVAPHIQVRTRQVTAADAPTLLDPTRTQGYYRIDIIDNGIGFDPRYIDRIFQVFQRLHSKAKYAGTGIGLAICEKVVNTHGGAITAASKLAEGATFTVYLPL